MTHHTGHPGPLDPSDPNHPHTRTPSPPHPTPHPARTTPVHPPGTLPPAPNVPPGPDWMAVTVEDTAEDSPHDRMQAVTLHSSADLADALPYLLGYRPEECMVLAAVHSDGPLGRIGARARLTIPSDPDDWPEAARQLAATLIETSTRRRTTPDGLVAFLCDEPRPGSTGRQLKEYLHPLAQLIRTACGSLDVPVLETMCISGGRFWSYSCVSGACCPAEGTPLGVPGTSVLAAAAAYAGLRVRGSLKSLRARLLPRETDHAKSQESALNEAALKLVPRILDPGERHHVAVDTLTLARNIMRRLATAAPAATDAEADRRDDSLLDDQEAATLILGLQDRTTRDYAARWTQDGEGATALRLWRALARRCVGSYGEHAAPPLTLVGWVAWAANDELEAREALAMALGADPEYLFARLLHQACNEGMTPAMIRECLDETTLRTPEGKEITVPDAPPLPGAAPTPDPAAKPQQPGPAPTAPSASATAEPPRTATASDARAAEQPDRETDPFTTPPPSVDRPPNRANRPRRPLPKRPRTRNGRAGAAPRRRDDSCRPPSPGA